MRIKVGQVFLEVEIEGLSALIDQRIGEAMATFAEEMKEILGRKGSEINSVLATLEDRIAKAEEKLASGEIVSHADIADIKSAAENLYKQPAPVPLRGA
jgi:hypothetical protein